MRRINFKKTNKLLSVGALALLLSAFGTMSMVMPASARASPKRPLGGGRNCLQRDRLRKCPQTGE
jgi:hypothetical protein